MTLSLGIDIGTSGVRTAVLEGDVPISMARAAHAAQDPNRIDATAWWGAVQTCLMSQMTALRDIGRDPGEVSRIAVDGTSGSMVLTDAALTPVSPALMYNSKGFDTESAQIAQFAPASHITRGSNSALARAMRLISLARAPAAHLLHQADFITAKLTERGGHSDDNNALKTGFDPETECWPDWIGQVIDEAVLPTVHRPGATIACVAPAIAQQFGLAPTATVHAGTTDSIAAFLAAAPLEQGNAVTSIGSTLAVKVLSQARIDLPAMGLYSHRIGPFWLAGGASNSGGAVLAQFFSPDELTQLSADIDTKTPSGLDYYPLREPGERFPINDPALIPRLTPRPEDNALFLKGLFEGIADIEARCYHLITDQGGPAPRQIFSAGGASHNAVFTRIRERILGLKLSQATYTEACIGTARLAQLAP